MIIIRKKLSYTVTNLFRCQFIHSKYHTDWPGLQSRPISCETGDWVPETWHGHTCTAYNYECNDMKLSRCFRKMPRRRTSECGQRFWNIELSSEQNLGVIFRMKPIYCGRKSLPYPLEWKECGRNEKFLSMRGPAPRSCISQMVVLRTEHIDGYYVNSE